MIPDPGMEPDDPVIPQPGPRTLRVTLAEIILGLVAFGGVSVGIPLVLGLLTRPELTDGDDWIVPVGFLAYGVASAIALVAERRRLRWALAAVVGSQVPWIVAMLWAYLTVAPDWSLLVGAGLALAAVVSAVLVRVRR